MIDSKDTPATIINIDKVLCLPHELSKNSNEV